jgi:hypothetical protein
VSRDFTAIARDRTFVVEIHAPVVADSLTCEAALSNRLGRICDFPSRESFARVYHQIVMDAVMIGVSQYDESGFVRTVLLIGGHH